ncbi:ExeM/NucH family extracellular endonuclease [Geodermatophilus marinus]|uniref:ExeM/NucH family extracellular endonuclease n=1 Tax=Geodermatophilus sp. LHW52908 TaxID=2303986 RepID=UPI000E3E2E8C|nr:ExeM/NucH family extracellular endonuclease [Geodermatophilus sp. LHW52908]RFU19030.1 nuclease [Geodermatophilus sp. LHW52908]
MTLRRTTSGALLSTLGAGLLVSLSASPASAVSDGLVISQVYGAGGNSGAVLAADYVELYNRGTVPVSTAGLSLQYASATGSGGFAPVALPGATVPPGGRFLVRLAGGSTGAPLPDPDATGSLNLSGSSGKVALVDGTTSLGCNGGSAACSDAQLGRIVDLLGYGTANFAEGSPAPAAGPAAALFRLGDGAQDTDDNAADFTTAAPAPRNSGGTAPEQPDPAVTTIAEVQGAGAASPVAGDRVTVEGVVVGDFQGAGEFGGFFVQSTQPDDDPLTSEGLRVFRNAPAVEVGQRVRVTGTVEEFESADLYTGSETQLGSGSTVEVLGPAELPDPVELSLPFELPAGGVDGQERYEGMLVTVPAGLVATDLYTLGRFGEVALTTGELLRIPTSAAEDAANDADRVLLDDGRSGQNLTPLPWTVGADGATLPRAGDALAEPVTGVLSFAFGAYRVEPAVGTTAAFERRNPRTAAPGPVGGDVQVASFNVLNYFVEFGGDNRGADDPAELERQQAKLVSAITALDADVVGLIEIANDGGAALDTLVAALNAAQPDPADHYTAVAAPDLTPPNSLGGTYGTDAIRTAIVHRASVVTPAGPPPSDPALLNPTDPEFPGPVFDRPPAVQAFTPVGSDREFTVVVSHLKSKGSTNPQCGTPDPFGGNCDDLRERQAAALVDLVAGLGAEDALLLGDFNAYETEDPIEVLTDAGYTSTAARLPTADRYSYSFDGEFGTLDYVFASPGLAGDVTGVDIWHVNSAEAPAYTYDDVNQPSLYAPDAHASSDHDPVLVGLELNAAPVADAGGPCTTRVGRDVLLDASGSTDDGGELRYAWDLDGDGAFDDASGASVPVGTGLPPGRRTVQVQVTDGAETSVAEAVLTITTPTGRVPPGRR